jgi:hypothetical protein
MGIKSCSKCGNAVLSRTGAFDRCSSVYGEKARYMEGCDSFHKPGTPQTMSDSEHLQALIARERSDMKKRMNESDDL